MKVLVFKTSVSNKEQINHLGALLNAFGKWNFDLDDCDRILRIESEAIQPDEGIRILEEQGFTDQELE